MAKRPTQAAPTPAPLTSDQMRKGISKLERRIKDLESLDPTTVEEDEVTALEKSIEETLERVFGKGTSNYNRYWSASTLDDGPISMGGWGAQAPRQTRRFWAEGKSKALSLLRQAVKSLNEQLEDDDGLTAPSASAEVTTPKTHSDKVFIVHGRDDVAKLEVARFVESVGLKPIILHEQANQGRTLIEKFEHHSDVGYAVVLLTPDDEGSLKGEPSRDRARQNVVLELGFFVGRLGRDRVTALVKGDVEVPSDITGLVWTPLTGNWMWELSRELKAAGYTLRTG